MSRFKTPYNAAPQIQGQDVLGAPLYSADAEKAVLGAMIVQPHEVIDEVVEQLTVDDFFVPAHREIFDAVKMFHMDQKAIDIGVLHQHFLDRKMADQVGSPGLLAEIAAGVATHLTFRTYTQIVKSKSTLRRLQHICQIIAQKISDIPDDVNQVLDTASREIFAITDQTYSNAVVPARDEIARTIEMIRKYATQRGRLQGISTGMSKLDLLTTGWRGGQMIVLAARPGVGKTALALHFARSALKERYDEEKDTYVKPGYSVGFFSLEMTNQQIMLRLLSAYSQVDLKRIRSGELDEATIQAMVHVSEEVKHYPLYLDETSYLTIDQLRAKARRMKAQFKIDMIIIDYLQLLHSASDQAKENRQVEVAEISRGIKSLAKELNVPIIVLAQLNRKSEEGKDEPALHNLRESGSIEQDADIVMLLHRPKEKEGETTGTIIPYKIIIAKQRDGPTDSIDIMFNAPYTRFEDPLRH